MTGVRFKAPDKAKYMKLRHPASGFAVVGVRRGYYQPSGADGRSWNSSRFAATTRR